jgi:hypothetical protein
MSTPQQGSAEPANVVMNAKWEAKINGKRALNGTRYGVTFDGTIAWSGAAHHFYFVIEHLVKSLRSENKEMELPDSIQLTLSSLAHAPSAGDRIGLERIVRLVSASMGDVTSDGPRTNTRVWPRFVTYWLALGTGHRGSDVAEFFRRDRCGITYGVRRVDEERSVNPKFREVTDAMLAEVMGGAK